MAEDFIEEIYQKAIIPNILRECVTVFNKCDYPKARRLYNGAVSKIEKLLPEYAAFDKESAERLQNAAIEVADNFSDVSFVTGIITGKLIPEIYRYLAHFADIEVEDGGYLLKSTDSGFLTVKDISQNIYLHDIHDPMEEAGRITDIIYGAMMEEIHIFGCGLGYLAYVIWKRSGGAVKVTIYEESQAIINYAQNYGVLSWIDKESLEIVCDKDETLLLGHFFDNVELDNSRKCIYISPQKRGKFYSSFDGNFEYVAATLAYQWGLDTVVKINAWKNKKIESLSFSELARKVCSEEWIVVAAGPSLDYNIDFIRKNKGKKKIIAVNTVIRRLKKEDIKPDIIVVADSDEQIVEHIVGAEDITEGVPLIADYVSNWKFISLYRGEKIFICTPSSIGVVDQEEGMWDVSGTISSMAIEAAVRLGAKKIYLVGLDLAYPGGKNYANDMPHEQIKSARGSIMIPSVDGGEVETVPGFLSFLSIIECKISKCKDTSFVNMSKNGALINGTTAFSEEGQ